jgi:hypothetical protein
MWANRAPQSVSCCTTDIGTLETIVDLSGIVQSMFSGAFHCMLMSVSGMFPTILTPSQHSLSEPPAARPKGSSALRARVCNRSAPGREPPCHSASPRWRRSRRAPPGDRELGPVSRPARRPNSWIFGGAPTRADPEIQGVEFPDPRGASQKSGVSGESAVHSLRILNVRIDRREHSSKSQVTLSEGPARIWQTSECYRAAARRQSQSHA